MAQRSFVDGVGTSWKVWDVQPTWAERRAVDRRRALAAASEERRAGTERRVRAELRVRLSPGLEHGWLAFESAAQKRRLAPIPTDWSQMPTGALAALCGRALATPKK